jgi:hypothetical protein
MADDDAPLIIGTIIALAAIFALNHPGSSSPASSSSRSSSTTHSSSTATLTSASTFPKCTRVQRLSSRDGKEYTEFPTSASRSRNCILGRGDVGPAVTALQRGLSLCMHEPLTVDGVYGPTTARRVSHAGQVAGGSSAFYQPSAERHLNWPWYSSSTTAFAGHCS